MNETVEYIENPKCPKCRCDKFDWEYEPPNDLLALVCLKCKYSFAMEPAGNWESTTALIPNNDDDQEQRESIMVAEQPPQTETINGIEGYTKKERESADLIAQLLNAIKGKSKVDNGAMVYVYELTHQEWHRLALRYLAIYPEPKDE